MERHFIVETVATVTYKNYCNISEELWNEYKEEYPDVSDNELAKIIFYDNECLICDTSDPIAWDNEEVTDVWEEE